MYKVLLAVKDIDLKKQIRKLQIWGAATGFEISDETDDFNLLLDKLRKENYPMILLEDVPEQNTRSLLRAIKAENLCRIAAFVNATADYYSVRKSFLIGADDYLAPPFEVSWFVSLFRKIENAEHGNLASKICRQEELLTMFEQADTSMRERLDELFYYLISRYGSSAEAEQYLKQITEYVCKELFSNHAWMNNFFSESDYTETSYASLSYEAKIKKRLEDFYSFFLEFAELYPMHTEKMDEILVYILNNPDSDLKQKTIADELYMNRSYLSTFFNAQLGVNFVEYVNTVKLKRAAWYLRHTDKKVIDIAGSLDYRDMGYFLRRFKAKYGMTPSQYRIPESYDFQI